MKIDKQAVFFSVLLAVVSSALWEELFRPIYKGSLFYLIEISTLGIKSVQDSLYLQIAKGFHENISLQIFSLILGFFMSLPMAFLIKTFSRKYRGFFKLKFFTKAENPERRRHIFSETFVVLYFIFFLIFSLFELFKINFINQSIAYYNQLYSAVSPYLEDSEEELIESNFAQIENEVDYNSVIYRLEDIAKQNGVEIMKN